MEFYIQNACIKDSLLGRAIVSVPSVVVGISGATEGEATGTAVGEGDEDGSGTAVGVDVWFAGATSVVGVLVSFWAAPRLSKHTRTSTCTTQQIIRE